MAHQLTLRGLMLHWTQFDPYCLVQPSASPPPRPRRPRHLLARYMPRSALMAVVAP